MNQKKASTRAGLKNTGSNVSNVVPSQREYQGLMPSPERIAIIIIIIRTCKAFFLTRSNNIDSRQ